MVSKDAKVHVVWRFFYTVCKSKVIYNILKTVTCFKTYLLSSLESTKQYLSQNHSHDCSASNEGIIVDNNKVLIGGIIKACQLLKE